MKNKTDLAKFEDGVTKSFQGNLPCLLWASHNPFTNPGTPTTNPSTNFEFNVKLYKSGVISRKSITSMTLCFLWLYNIK